MPDHITLATTAKARYSKLETDRNLYLDRARDGAKYTIPSLIRPNDVGAGAKLPEPYQGLGARGVNNLASKLLLALHPPGSPFFQMRVDPKHQEELDKNPGLKTELDKTLSKYERITMEEIERAGDRVGFFEAFKHLLVAGNVLLFVSGTTTRVFHLNRYVVKRQFDGEPIDIIVKETFTYDALPKEAQEIVGLTTVNGPGRNIPLGTLGTEKTYDLYTWVKRTDSEWVVHQEIEGRIIPGTDGTYPFDKTPWLPLRLIRIDGEDYGRGYVDEYLGDLKSLEALSRAIVEGSAAAAKVLFLVKPNGTTRMKTLSESPNGAVREGNAEDVTVLQVDKFADFRMARETMNKIEERLSFAFLLNSAIQRPAERVTAEEIRFMAQELESALGGVYSILTQEFQLPYVRRKLIMLEKLGRLPVLPKGIVNIAIVTGLEALGRGNDRNKLERFIDTLTKLTGPQAVASLVNISELTKRLALADGIDTDGLIKTKEEMAAEKRAAIQQQALSEALPKAVGPAIKAMSDGNIQQQKNEGQG